MDGRDSDTEIGGIDRGFPATQWTEVLAAGDTPDLGGLVQSYWKPVYAYIRCGHARSNEDAKDLTQDFFAWMIETRLASRADPRRGRFRSFLKTALRNFLTDAARESQAQKRGGGRVVLISELGPAEISEPAAQSTPDEALDIAWRNEIIERACERLKAEFQKDGRQQFAIFQEYFLADADDIDYRTLAARHGMTTDDVSYQLRTAKDRFRAHVGDIVRETVASPLDQAEELAELFGGKAR